MNWGVLQMKKTLHFIMLFVFIFIITACGVSPTEKTSSSLNDIQNIVRETQNAFENNKYQETQNGISKLVELSKNSFYSESERLIAQYCATYINAGVMLDYIAGNDNQWLSTHDIAEFDIFYRGIFVDIINGKITHVDTLKEYCTGLVHSTQEIYSRYTELRGK